MDRLRNTHRQKSILPFILAGLSAAAFASAVWPLGVELACNPPVHVPYTFCEFWIFFGWPLVVGLPVAAYARWRPLRIWEQGLTVCVACACYIFVIAALISAVFQNRPDATGSFFQHVLLWSRAIPSIISSWAHIAVDGVTNLSNGLAIGYFLAASVSLLAWNALFWLLLPRRRTGNSRRTG